jgi:hypothetical protein
MDLLSLPYLMRGYPVVPALFFLATAYLMINTLLATPGRALTRPENRPIESEASATHDGIK